MKELSLSLLSRGCGQLASSEGNTGGHGGRLDVCFTPKDYYIWKSQESVLRLTNSGRLLVAAEPALPKTYSTRRGPLLLYSQDLVTTKTTCELEAGQRKKRLVRRCAQQAEQQQQRSTLKELTAAVLNYSNNQNTFPRPARSLFPSLHFSPVQDLHCPGRLSIHPTRAQPRPEFVPVNSQWCPAEEDAEQLASQPEKEEELGSRKIVRLDVFLQRTSTSRTPTPQTESQSWVHYVATTPEEPEDTQVGWPSPDSAEQHNARRLPPIAENGTVASASGIQDQSRQRCSERHGIKSVENPQRLHERPSTLPPLVPKKDEETSGKLRRGKEKSERQVFTKQTAGQEGGGGRSATSVKGSTILLEPEDETLPPLAGASGWKGPSKRSSSSACFQNRLLHLQDPGDDNRSAVKGVLPLELRDLQDDKSAGCLILGPDGEIIQLSLYDDDDNDNDNNNREPTQADDDTQQRALQVLSSEGETLPWVIVLKSENSHTAEQDTELRTDDAEEKVRRRLQPLSKRTGSHMTVSQFASGQQSGSAGPLLDFHKSPESEDTGSANSRTHTVTAQIGAMVMETQTRKTKKEARNGVRTPPPRERVGRKEPGEGDTEAEEGNEEDEELDAAGQSGLLSASHQPGKKYKDGGHRRQQNPHVATSEDAVDRRRKSFKNKDTDEAAVNSGKRPLKPLKTSDPETKKKNSTRSKEGGGDSSQPIRSRRPGARTDGEAAGARDQSAPPPVEKETREEGERGGGEKMNEEREVRRGATEERKMRRRRRRRKLSHDADENPVDKEEVDSDQEEEEEEEEESYLKYTTETQNQENETNTEGDKETRRGSASDERRSVRSVSSLRSSGAASRFIPRTARRSAASSCEAPAGVADLASSRGRLSSCSTVMVTDEQLMLNPMKPELSRLKQSQEQQVALRLAQRAERRRQELERKRREREEEERKQQEREQMEERMKGELDEERRRRAEELRLKKVSEDEETRRREEEEETRARREQARREAERRRQEERRRQLERLQEMREEEEQRRRAELERLQLEERRRREEEEEEEREKLQEMDEGERFEYLRRKEQEEEERRRREEETRRREEEEARTQAQKLLREMALLQRHLAFKRGLALEAGGLENTQGISRPWVYSYFLGLDPTPS